MKWSPPHIEHCRWLARRLPLALILTGFSSGCSAIPVLHPPVNRAAEAAATSPYTAEEKARMAAMPRVPDFDAPGDTAKSEVSPPVVSTINPQNPDVRPPGNSAMPPDPAKADNPAVADNPVKTDNRAKIEAAPVKRPAVASTEPKGILVTPPKPFSWQQTGSSTGNRPFLTTTIGDDGYRTLVVGSIGGNDPVALELVDQLARHLHEDSVIIGGFESTVIRTLNPDGEAGQNFLNQNGQYINHGFPKAGDTASGEQPAEVGFLLDRLQQLQPQRVLHIRTVQGNTGLIAASASCQTVATEAATWLGFKLVNLPDKAVAGSMERYLATKGSCDIITLAVPENSARGELWNLYGDTLLNLLLGDDFKSRELARQQAQQSSADRRNQSLGK